MAGLHAFLECFAVADDSGLDHLAQQVVSFASALAHAGKDGKSVVLLRDVVDQLHNQDRLSYAGSPEQADLASFGIRFEQVDHLDAGVQDFTAGGQVFELGRFTMDRKSPFLVEFGHSVNGVPRYVHQTPFYLVADRHRDGRTVRNGFHSSLQPVCRIHRYGADRVFPNMLLDFHNQDFPIGAGYLHCVVDAGKCYLFFLAIIEMDVHDRADNL